MMTAIAGLLQRQKSNVITVIDVCEVYGLGYVCGTAFACLAEANAETLHAAIIRARMLLQRFIDDPHDMAVEFDADAKALEWATPQKIVATFGLKGNVAIAATYILNAAAFADDEELEIAKAIVALEKEI